MVRDQDVALGGFGGAGPRTIFQTGSVTKVFTALLFAFLAERGQLSPSDPAARYLPGATGPVTLTDLATHTSGLSRLPRSLRLYALTSPRDPYARYPAAQFVHDARRALRTARPGAYAYSNFGYGVLGYLLGQAAASTYQALITEHICGPLSLADTAFEPPTPPRAPQTRTAAPPRTAPPRTEPAPPKAQMAQGHRRGRPVPPWHMGPLAAAGGLYSTAADLAKVLQACLTASQPPDSTPPQPQDPTLRQPSDSTPPQPQDPTLRQPPDSTPPQPQDPIPALAAAIRATLTPRRQIPGGEIGLAWHHTRHGDQNIIWHNGMTGGFSSMIALNPARRLAVAALANSADAVPPLDTPVLNALT